MNNLVLVIFGGGAGAAARYAVGSLAGRWLGAAWPYGTLICNLVGGLAMGVLVATLAQRGGEDQERWRLLLGVGVLGGFTTFSAFSLETALMIEKSKYGQALGYATASVVLSVVALFLGLYLTRRVLA
jgi:CrcB protein